MQDILTWNYTVIPALPPGAPSRLVAAPASGTQINLTWHDNANNEAGFLVQQRTAASAAFTTIGVTGPNTAGYMDTQLSPSVVYIYRLRATNGAGLSAPSVLAAARTPVAPATPTGARTTKLTATEVDLAWTDNAKNETGYRVLRTASTSGNFVVIGDLLPPDTTHYVDKANVSPGITYDCHIQCSNLAGYSDFTGLSVTTPVQ